MGAHQTLAPASRAETGRLADADLGRYRRQLILEQIGLDGQRALSAANLLVIGSGGLGAPALLYLVAAGVGRITLVDFDVVDEGNLHRQVLFSQTDIGQPKITAAAARLAALNPAVDLRLIEARLTPANAASLMTGHDLVIDATDNFAARYAINDAAAAAGIPNISASIQQFQAQVTVFDPAGGAPCYRCLYPVAPPAELAPSCAEAGVLGVLPGILGCLQANEAIKLICGYGQPLRGRLVMFDAAETRFTEYDILPRPDCACCKTAPRRAAAPARKVTTQISVADLRRRMVQPQSPVIVDVREAAERASGMIDGAVGIALSELPARVAELPRGVPVACICQKGKRSVLAAQMLAAAGVDDVVSVAGGMDEWEQTNG